MISNKVISAPIALAIMAFPLLIWLGILLLTLSPSNYGVAKFLTREDGAVEWITACLALIAALQSISIAVRLNTVVWRKITKWFYVLFATGMMLVFLEEIAWGQRIFGIETPEFLKHVNRQGEMTLHNIGAMQGHNEIWLLFFGVSGIFGILMRRIKPFTFIYPSIVLASWFLVISVDSLLDIFDPYWYTNAMSEVVEMLLCGSAVIYLELNRRRLKSQNIL